MFTNNPDTVPEGAKRNIKQFLVLEHLLHVKLLVLEH
jgi:hypothetical protein